MARLGGRAKGTPNKRTVAREAAMAEAAGRIASLLGRHDCGLDAHGLLVSIYRDTRQPLDVRMAAARDALPYEKPRLGALKIAGDEEGSSLIVQIVKFADLPIDKQLAYAPPLAQLPAAGSAD